MRVGRILELDTVEHVAVSSSSLFVEIMDGGGDALKAVERVLSGAVSKVLSKFKTSAEHSTSRTSKPRSRGRGSTEPSGTSAAGSSRLRSRDSDSDSSDSDDFQPPPRKSR